MRAHIIDAAEPLTEGRTLTALCGAQIEYAHFVFSYEGDMYMFRDFLNAMTQCRKCVIKAEEKIVDNAEELSGERSYWYGLVAGLEG